MHTAAPGGARSAEPGSLVTVHWRFSFLLPSAADLGGA
jgi:hypothetical protein